MKALRLLTLLWLVARVALVAQPVMTNGFHLFDFDGDGVTDLEHTISVRYNGSQPEDWFGSYGMVPYRQSRFLKAQASRVLFHEDESIDSTKLAYAVLVPVPPLPPQEAYGLGFLSYRALSYDGGATWEYSARANLFEEESKLLLGLKLVLSTGTHYGWLRLTRPVVDLHTPFELAGYAYHPVPGEPIGAGEPPPLPPLRVQAEEGGFAFSWDPRWGELVLESTASLESSATWAPVTSSAGGPVSVATGGETRRFFRLRRP